MIVQFSEFAKKELSEARDWYEERESGLGIQFVQEILSRIKWIGQNPFSSSRVEHSLVRCTTVHMFPYYIYYEINELNNTIVILAIAHQRRAPDYREI